MCYLRTGSHSHIEFFSEVSFSCFLEFLDSEMNRLQHEGLGSNLSSRTSDSKRGKMSVFQVIVKCNELSQVDTMIL